MMFENSPGSIAAIILAAITVLWISDTIRWRFRTGLRRLPGPRLAAYSGLWRFLNVASGHAHYNYRKLHDRYGKIVRTGPNHVSISDTATIPIIYGINNRFLKSRFYFAFIGYYEGAVMPNLFTATDPAEHKGLKSSVANKYSMSSMRELEPQVDECTKMFTKIMGEYADADKVVDLGVWLQWYAFDVIGEITFQRTFGFMEERKDLDNMISSIEWGLKYASVIGQVPEFHSWLLGNLTLSRNLAKIPGFGSLVNQIPKFIKITEDLIEKYDEEGGGDESRSDFLAWFRRKDEKSPGRMPRNELMSHLLNNLLAGSDTTAISIRAIFYYLMRNPPAYKKVIDEIDEADREGRLSKAITYEECLRLPYVQATIKEAMRLHPGVGLPLERCVPQGGETLCDVFLPEGTVVGINAWVIHHDKSVFGEDTDSFRPERWLESSPEQLILMEKCFFPFGAGTRMCMGRNISMLEMSKMVPQFLRAFDIVWASSKKEWEIRTYWFAQQTGVQVRLKRRHQHTDVTTHDLDH